VKAYKVSCDGGDDCKPEYRPTREEAHNAAKDFDKDIWDDVRIELIEYKTDQKTICEILSGWGCEEKVLRTWAITERGGMKEVPNGE
jgi:hypothetical protein